ncbi:MAG: efflux RND transporter periplasmic adaptor subunit [Gemmatimonadota bacterium]
MLSTRWIRTGALFLLVACGKQKPPMVQQVPVTVATARVQAVPYELVAVGTVEPMQSVAVQPQVNGQLIRVTFREGDEVEKGQVLFQIDPRPFQAALAQAQAILARDRAQSVNAEQELKRFSSLAEKEYITAQQYDQSRANAAGAQATLAADQAAVDQAELNLQYATVRAPIAGRTGSLLVREGNQVRSDGTTLVTINQVHPILVRFAVPASNLSAIQKYRSTGGLLVQAVAASGGTPEEGQLSFVDNAVDSTTGTIMLKGNFSNHSGNLWPGGFVNVTLRLYVQDSAMVIPLVAVMSGQNGGYVYAVRADSTAVTKKVTVEREAGDLAVVSGEVKDGERIVTDGQLLLRPGARVQIRTASGTATSERQGGP